MGTTKRESTSFLMFGVDDMLFVDHLSLFPPCQLLSRSLERDRSKDKDEDRKIDTAINTEKNTGCPIFGYQVKLHPGICYSHPASKICHLPSFSVSSFSPLSSLSFLSSRGCNKETEKEKEKEKEIEIERESKIDVECDRATDRATGRVVEGGHARNYIYTYYTSPPPPPPLSLFPSSLAKNLSNEDGDKARERERHKVSIGSGDWCYPFDLCGGLYPYLYIKEMIQGMLSIDFLR